MPMQPKPRADTVRVELPSVWVCIEVVWEGWRYDGRGYKLYVMGRGDRRRGPLIGTTSILITAT